MESIANISSLELPAALVNELIENSEEIGKALSDSIKEVNEAKPEIRKWLEETGLLKKDSDLPPVEIPTCCGVDGGLAPEELLSNTIIVCAAVAVEGFTPPTEKKSWPLKYESYCDVEPHRTNLETIASGWMQYLEAKLAHSAPHDVILLDGSMTSLWIRVNQSMQKVEHHKKIKQSTKIGEKLLSVFSNFLTIYDSFLDSNDKIFAALPKSTVRSELGKKYDNKNGWPLNLDDKAVMTAVLEPGEYTEPLLLTTREDNWHMREVGMNSGFIEKIAKKIGTNLMVFQYRPFEFTPALRIETSKNITDDDKKFAKLLQCIKSQFESYSVMEPFPLYLADRMVKNLYQAIPAIRSSALQKMSKDTTVDMRHILYALRPYRTEI